MVARIQFRWKRLVYYNDRIQNWQRHPRKEGTWSWEGLLHQEDQQPTIDAWEKAIRKESPVYEIAHRIKVKNGNYHWHLSRAYPQRNEQGKIVKWFGTATDIHEQKLER